MEVDQTSTSASKPGPSNTVHLDPSPPRPRPTSHSVESMEVDYGPSLPPRLGADPSRRVDDALDHHLDVVEEPLRLPSTEGKNTLILTNSMILSQARTNTQIRPMTLGLHLVDPKSMLTKLNTKPGPYIFRLLQRRISPLYPDTGLQNLPGRPILIKTNLNMTQTHLTIGK